MINKEIKFLREESQILKKKFQKLQQGKENDQSFLMLQNQLNGLVKTVDSKL